MWSIYGSETAVSETAISQLQNRSKYRILHSILQSNWEGYTNWEGYKKGKLTQQFYLQ